MKKGKKRIKHKVKHLVHKKTVELVEKVIPEKKKNTFHLIIPSIIFLLGFTLIFSSFRSLTGNVVSTTSGSFAVKSAIGLIAILGSIWWCLEVIKDF